MEKVALYLTFKKKHDNRFRDSQMEYINNYCLNKKYDYDLYLDIVDNNLDVSRRKDLDRLKQKIEEQEYDKVLIKSMSNLSRNHLFCIDFIKFLRNNDCLLETVNNNEVNYKVYDEIDRLMKKINNKEREEIVR